ncbi:hypothetical protein FNH09_17155 [Streptomyces adustus]|uniref:Uncharacterized protein n=1 Tax=Streptomyces adustus TaxID=1609272 RepID=A0A5N8VD34_9ACTN|nr:hypothetical protein [Streptomyces adustus]MPY32929.1 hypothetical protein [Streptomyces adustus]
MVNDNLAASRAEERDKDRVPLSGDLTAAGHWHVLPQLDALSALSALSAQPCVTPRLADRSLRLHAWFHGIQTRKNLPVRPACLCAFLPL